MGLLIFFAFLAGLVTVLSPCILPVLPIVLSSSVGSGHRRPLGVVAGFITSFTFFTLFLSQIVRATGIPADALRFFSVVVIIGFGASLFIPRFTLVLERAFTFFSRFAPAEQKDGFWGGFIVGMSLGLIWTPCVGPILASVITLALSGSISGSAALITLAYAMGTGLPMLMITYGGRNLLLKVPWLTSHTKQIQKVFGAIMILTGIAIALNFDRQFQAWVLTTFPNYGVGLTQFENRDQIKKQLDMLDRNSDEQSQSEDMGKPLFSFQDALNYPIAPDLIGGTHWVNSEPLLLSDQLKGKVVLVDFWTYSCINCIRTFPYLTSWYEQYKERGFVIVGVHSPEFEFEKNTDNVRKAMADFGITYPVVQDNDFTIWRAYKNRFWPAHYLIDKNGRVRYTHFGEGKYQETENKIRELIGEEPLPDSGRELDTSGSLFPQTPETYLGYERAASYTSENKIEIEVDEAYTFSEPLPENAVGLKGHWKVGAERITAMQDGAELHIHFQAKKVHLVMASVGGSKKVTVLLDGKPLPSQYLTEDTNEQGEIVVQDPRKYDVIDLGDDYGKHVLTLIPEAGVEAYAFTFGS